MAKKEGNFLSETAPLLMLGTWPVLTLKMRSAQFPRRNGNPFFISFYFPPFSVERKEQIIMFYASCFYAQIIMFLCTNQQSYICDNISLYKITPKN
jgi:hypothetical protein